MIVQKGRIDTVNRDFLDEIVSMGMCISLMAGRVDAARERKWNRVFQGNDRSGRKKIRLTGCMEKAGAGGGGK